MSGFREDFLVFHSHDKPRFWMDHICFSYFCRKPSNDSFCQITLNSDKWFKGTVKPECVKRPLIKDKTKILMTNDILMKVESIVECSPLSILQYFDLH